MTIKHFWNLSLLGIAMTAILIACSPKSDKKNSASSSYEKKSKSITSHSSDEEEETSDNDDTSSSDCKYEDGTHSATVDYYNPQTGYTSTYTLDVEVADCEVVQIEFPNGGWLDSDHITPAELDEDGSCTIDGENGKTYEIQIDD